MTISHSGLLFLGHPVQFIILLGCLKFSKL